MKQFNILSAGIVRSIKRSLDANLFSIDIFGFEQSAIDLAVETVFTFVLCVYIVEVPGLYLRASS